ncbi:uncharacterized protein LOC119072352 [Bradysia coprophila]|uniref:uncharacterized protein LOC119072352 n=1 Tax=Bradysia coprophila TaxID=38358 RepID=UPI00187D857E|nr:uncharacterized protein LOC119072352 [Bradysia coprophila]
MNGSAKPIAGVLSTRQLLFARDPEVKKRSDQNMKDFLNSSEMLPQSEFPYVGSDDILNHLFDVINRQVFNANLDGIKLEWCDTLSSRAIIAYEQSTYATRQTYIRCSKAWFRNRNRQQFVEAILYELIHLYVKKRGAEAGEETSPDLMAYVIYGGLDYFNVKYEMNLVLNQNHKSGNVDDTEVVRETLKSTLRERKASTGKIPQFTLGPEAKLLSRRITGNKNAVKCDADNGCGGFCYGSGCPAAAALRQRYLGSNIYFLFTVERPLECFLCENKGKGTLNAHFNKDCKAFGRPKKNVHDDQIFLL